MCASSNCIGLSPDLPLIRNPITGSRPANPSSLPRYTNSAVLTLLKMFFDSPNNIWGGLVLRVLFTFCSTVHYSTGVTPAQERVEPASPIELTTSGMVPRQARRSCASSLDTFTQSTLTPGQPPRGRRISYMIGSSSTEEMQST